MTPPPYGKYSEDQLVEQPTIELFAQLGWQTINAHAETLGPDGTLGRDNQSEVILALRLRAALERLNPGMPPEAVEDAVTQLGLDRSASHFARANREVHTMLRDGVSVRLRRDDGGIEPENLRVIDWNSPEHNDFLLVSQMSVHSDMYHRRTDLVGFVNGIPLVFLELKASHKSLYDAYRQNLSDYRTTIPRLFVPNGFVILSNGAETKVGTVSSEWDHFAEWKKISDEGEPGRVSLDTVVRGTCAKAHLLDLIENFVIFMERPGGLVKIMAKNHQYLGVNNALARLEAIRTGAEEENGRLGVFWHTQGSGKTLAMLFFSQKVLRTLPGNWTFVIVTDRTDLDDQAYKEFTDAGVLSEKHLQATGGEHLRTLLGEDHRFVFTLIQKFRTTMGAVHPVLSERNDVVVITDEAHRSQYDVMALNMRNALPNASFLGFTGTPLIAGEEKTREVFGDYVSVYNFAASIRDHATVPLYFENRSPQLQLSNPDFGNDLIGILEVADVDDEQEAKLGRLLGKQYEVITRDDRLDTVARDIVTHFLGRGFPGKAMVISIDKATAIRTFDKVQAHWAARLATVEERLAATYLADHERDLLSQEAAFLRCTEMAVVVSQAQNEVADMQRRGLDITPHRRRMVTEDLEGRFKAPQDPLRIAFVCAMWTTGFDVPSCSTIYLDKPMRNHTLMQTITRANRVFPEKNNGLIVAYVDVFGDLQKALALYAVDGGLGHGNLPVEDKAVLVAALEDAVSSADAHCTTHGVDLAHLQSVSGFDLVAAGRDAVERLIVTDEDKAAFLGHASSVNRLFKAVLPDPHANHFGQTRAVLQYLATAIGSDASPVDVSGVLARVEQLLDDSVAANAYVIPDEGARTGLIDLNDVDWKALEVAFHSGRRRTAAERLRAQLRTRAAAMARLNPTRQDLVEKIERLIDEYNAGSMNVDTHFAALVAFTKALDHEQARAVAEGLSEEQLAILDLLLRPAPDLSPDERAAVKRVAEELLVILKREKLVIDWRKEQASRAAVRVAVEDTLDRLPERFSKEVYRATCDVVYQHVFDSYWDDGRSVYDRAA